LFARVIMPPVAQLPHEESQPIRFVPHPLFAGPNALEQIESLQPAGADENRNTRATFGEMPRCSPLGKLCEQPLLTRGQQRYLFLRMNYEKFQASKTKGRERTLHLSRATTIRNRILMGNFRLLVSIAGQYATPAVQTEELVSEGVVPLLNAVELFDVARGWAFGTYATHVLRNHFRRTGHRRQRQNRLAGQMVASHVADVPDEGTSPQTQLELCHRRDCLAAMCLAELPATDQIILRARFGFDDPACPKIKSYAEVGQVVGLSKERVRVRTHRAIEQLRETAQNRRWEFPELETLNLRA
jgi:RNA polymerase primary sigma factor